MLRTDRFLSTFPQSQENVRQAWLEPSRRACFGLLPVYRLVGREKPLALSSEPKPKTFLWPEHVVTRPVTKRDRLSTESLDKSVDKYWDKT